MSKKIYQIYEIGKEMPEKLVEVNIKRYNPKTIGVPRHKKGEVPRGMNAIEEEIWRLKNKDK